MADRRASRPRLKLVWADGKYHDRRLERWLAKSEVGYRIEVVGRPAGSKGVVKLPRAPGGRADVPLAGAVSPDAVVIPYPFGGKQRQVQIDLNPRRCRRAACPARMSPTRSPRKT